MLYYHIVLENVKTSLSLLNPVNKTTTVVHNQIANNPRGCHGRDRMVVGFTTIYAISAHHH
jgi:hypothetical protein